MTISFKVQGPAKGDNSLLVRIDSGQAVERLLFDAGEGCVAGLGVSEVQAIGHLFFSHLHMDHVAGFDSFFRRTYDRTSRKNVVWGPPGTGGIMQCRFRGFLWNLHHGDAGTWHVRDVFPNRVEHTRYDLGEAFAIRHDEGETCSGALIADEEHYTVEALTMEHLTPTLAYIVREKPRLNLDPERLRELGLSPGPWIMELKSAVVDQGRIAINGKDYDRSELRGKLITETPGNSIAYLTDFLLDDAAMERLVPPLKNCTTLVCESQYRRCDLDLALRNHHMTSVQTAQLALEAQAGELVLIHVSDRYQPEECIEMLREARAVFPRTRFPEHWGMEGAE